MNKTRDFSWKRVAVGVLILILAIAALYKFGRSIWHPIFVKIAGEKSIADRMMEIEVKHKDLLNIIVKSVSIIAFKEPGNLQVYINGKPWRTYPLTAKSGTLGPKLMAGDGQIPEGIYYVESVNPNSSYHLSLRVSYPNDADIARSKALGVKDLGGDIYIHGKEASIGCLAIGDDAIEQVFYVVNKVNPSDVPVIIAPNDLRNVKEFSKDNEKLYHDILNNISRLDEGSNKTLKSSP